MPLAAFFSSGHVDMLSSTSDMGNTEHNAAWIAYFVKHIFMDVIQPLEFLALGGHELLPVMGRRAIQTPSATPNPI